eukprot:scaffold144835_cov130-Phaeocystis_antarctica.AAC.1
MCVQPPCSAQHWRQLAWSCALTTLNRPLSRRSNRARALLARGGGSTRHSDAAGGAARWPLYPCPPLEPAPEQREVEGRG